MKQKTKAKQNRFTKKKAVFFAGVLLSAKQMLGGKNFGYASTKFSSTSPWRISGRTTSLHKPFAKVIVTNSLQAKKLLSGWSVDTETRIISQKEKQHFYTAAKLLGMKVRTRQLENDVNKVQVSRKA